MHNTADFLDLLREKFQLPSDYAVSKLLGVSRQAISHYRHGNDSFSDEAAMKVAEFLNLEPGYVVACCRAQRASTPALIGMWETLAKKLSAASTALCALLVAGLLLVSPNTSQASFDITKIVTSFDTNNIHRATLFVGVAVDQTPL